MRRLTYSLALCPTLLLLACGGRVTEVVDDGGTDSASTSEVTPGDDGGTEVTPGEDAWPTDGGPGRCGSGACEPGMGCSDGCNTCRCVARNSWECTDLGCVDAEPPPPPPPCPFSPPYDGSYCPVEGAYCTFPNGCGGNIYASCAMGSWRTKRDGCTTPTCPSTLPTPMTACSAPTKCSYSNGCGGSNYAYCDGKYWNVERGPCSSPVCPPSQPAVGTACTGPNKCAYSNGCGGYNTAYCDGSMSKWAIYKGDCAPPPPPPPMCPTSVPPPGAPCVSGSSCNWGNGCGGLTYGYCSGGAWSLKPEGCTMGCPGAKPVSGTACKMPSATSCRYLTGGSMSCTSQCFCADDYRWACITPPCASDGGPGGGIPPAP